MEEIIVIKRKVVRPSAKKKAESDAEFDRITWAIKGRSIDDSRKSIYCIKIEPNKIIATDGHALLITDTETEYPSGCYNVLISTWKLIVLEKVDVDFPAYEKLFEFTNPPEKVREFSTYFKNGINQFVYEIYQLQAYQLHLLQRCYIPYQNIKLEWRGQRNPRAALIIKAPQQTALVMPLEM